MKISRRRARIAAFGAVFAVYSESGTSAADMLAKRRLSPADDSEAAVLADDLTSGIVESFDNRREDIEDLFAAAVRRPPEMISTAERAIICAAAAEVLAYPQTPHKIIINEAIDIAKKYGAESGYKLVNAALDNICHRIRD